MVKGGYKYVPKELLMELERIKHINCIDKDSEVFKRIAKNSRIGSDITTALDSGIGILDRYMKRGRK
jgi:hypothetical protein